MIDIKNINEKFKPLNDRIIEIERKFGEDTVSELLIRVEASLKSFLSEFEDLSSKSFASYWERQESIRFESDDKIGTDLNNENVPKFISDFKEKNNKK